MRQPHGCRDTPTRHPVAGGRYFHEKIIDIYRVIKVDLCYLLEQKSKPAAYTKKEIVLLTAVQYNGTLFFNYSAAVGGSAPVNPRPPSAGGGAVCFSYYYPFFLAYNGGINSLVLRLALLSASHRAFVVRVWHVRGEPRTPCRVSEALWVKIVSVVNDC